MLSIERTATMETIFLLFCPFFRPVSSSSSSGITSDDENFQSSSLNCNREITVMWARTT